MKSIKIFIFLGFLSIVAVACSNEEQESKKNINDDHIWKQQTDALKSAKDTAKKMQKSLNQQQEKMNKNN